MNMWSLIICGLYVTYGLIESTLDGWKSKKGGVIDHSTLNWSVVIRIVLGIGLPFILSFDGGVAYHLCYTVMLFFSFWIVFDLNFGFVKHGDSSYIGTTALPDKITRWAGVVDGHLYATIKFMFLGVIFMAYNMDGISTMWLWAVLLLISFVFTFIFITYKIKTKNGNKSKSKI